MTFEEATVKAIEFRNKRDWAQFHNPKDLAISLNLEAAELLEAFQWSGAELDVASNKDRMVDELADVTIYCIYLADALGIDLVDAVNNKIEINEERYPVDKAKGSAKKYTDL